MKISVGVSNRHAHLKEETYKKLFKDKKIMKRNDLNQIGEFASTDTVDLKRGDKVIEHVRVLGPFREEDQVELLGTDIEYFGIDVPTRRSGDLKDTPGITLVNGEVEVTIDHGVIRAERHVHVPTNREEELDLHEREVVTLHANGHSFDANVKVSDNGYFELHIDKEEAVEYGLKNGSEIELEKCGK